MIIENRKNYDKQWSNLNKLYKEQISRESTFDKGIDNLLKLREILMNELLSFKNNLKLEDFSKMPYPNTKGYYIKALAYSIWHIFRIEDIVVNSLVLNRKEVFKKYEEKIGSSIIATGNELVGKDIVDFSKKLNIDILYFYAIGVKNTTDEFWIF